MVLFEFCIRRPVFATVLSLILILIGVVSYDRLTVREYPNIDEPTVSVSTTYPGASADDHRKPDHPDAGRLDRRHRGHRRAGIDQPRRDQPHHGALPPRTSTRTWRPATCATASAACASACPTRSQEPTIAKVEADAQAVMYLVFRSERMSPLEITDYVDRFVVDRLKNLTGVADVTIFGERRYAMRIWIDRERLAAYALTVQDVESALRAQNVELPSGRIESRDREFTVLSRTGLQTPEQFGEIVVKLADGHQVKPRRGRPGRARRRRRAARQHATTAGPRSSSASSSRPPPTRSTCRTPCAPCCREINKSLPDGLERRNRQRQRGVHRSLDQGGSARRSSKPSRWWSS